MPEPVVTGITEPAPEVTEVESPEEPAGTGTETQDNSDQLNKLAEELAQFKAQVEAEIKAKAELEAEKTRVAAQLAEEAKKRAAAEAERDREVKIRKGIQSSTTQKLAELSALKGQIAATAALSDEITSVKQLVEYLAQRDLSPEDIEAMRQRQKAEKDAKELEAYRKAQAEAEARSQQPQPRLPELTPEYKEALYKDYFSDFTNVDPFDLTDEEWHLTDSKNDLHWYQQVRAEFEKRSQAQTTVVQNSTPAPAMSDETVKILAELEQFKAQREEDLKKQAETQAALELAQKEVAENKRLLEEQLNRSKGMDREHTPGLEQTPIPGAKKALQQLPPSSWLYGTPDQRKAYRDAMDNKDLRRQILGA